MADDNDVAPVSMAECDAALALSVKRRSLVPTVEMELDAAEHRLVPNGVQQDCLS